ncbi:MAG: hypothetical protein JSV05_06915 [Candidatus Bathyarchaeota archaeon]|nr:MAG: hypothetical protein JSV05_06915 [Candidatus Bathyarchaeota archaeon]
MVKFKVVSAKLPEEIYEELVLRVSNGERSAFIRDAIMEKLQQIPRPDKLFEFEKRVSELETKFSEIKSYLGKLEVLTYERGKANPHAFCIDETDHKIIDYLLHYKGATTPELAEYLKTNRWLILNRLRRIQKLSKKQLGKSIVEYSASEKRGKKKAWWLHDEQIED